MSAQCNRRGGRYILKSKTIWHHCTIVLIMTNSECQICNINTGKYSCPRCNIFYCSVDCYQSRDHLECSEVFYEKCVKEELENQKAGLGSKKKMMEILWRNLRESDSEGVLDSDDSECEPDLASRMVNVNLDDENVIWEKLTLQEKKEFKKLISSGEIIKIIPKREPWWSATTPKIISEEESSEKFHCQQCPPIHIEIPELTTLTKISPSPLVVNMLLNVLGAYACTVRWFKGIHLEMPVECASTLFALSATLRSNEKFQNPLEAFLSLEDNHCECKWLKNDVFDKNLVYSDLKSFARIDHTKDFFFHIKAALCDLALIASKAADILQDVKSFHLKRFTGPPPSIKQLHLMSRKITYYLSWTAKHGNLFVNLVNSF